MHVVTFMYIDGPCYTIDDNVVTPIYANGKVAAEFWHPKRDMDHVLHPF